MAKTYIQLTLDERVALKAMRMQKMSLSAIAAALGRAKSTVHSELNRNRQKDWYNPQIADSKAKTRRKKARRKSKLATQSPIFDFVKNALEKQWSPEQISGRLRIKYPDNPSMWISAQGIYDWIAKDKKAGASGIRIYAAIMAGVVNHDTSGATLTLVLPTVS